MKNIQMAFDRSGEDKEAYVTFTIPGVGTTEKIAVTDESTAEYLRGCLEMTFLAGMGKGLAVASEDIKQQLFPLRRSLVWKTSPMEEAPLPLTFPR